MPISPHPKEGKERGKNKIENKNVMGLPLGGWKDEK
jgi:hypothetical protein